MIFNSRAREQERLTRLLSERDRLERDHAELLARLREEMKQLTAEREGASRDRQREIDGKVASMDVSLSLIPGLHKTELRLLNNSITRLQARLARPTWKERVKSAWAARFRRKR